MSDARPHVQIAAAILRAGDRIAMVHQGAPGEELVWSIPSGRIEDGELVTDGLVVRFAR